jgi:prolipoprotein diacylglyceryltransferase
MIHVPTAPWAHPIFDATAWLAGLATSIALYRWRLRATTEHIARKIGPGYFVALCVGAIPAAWLAGTLNTMHDATPVFSHSVAGALLGAIIGVEIYKALFRIQGSTGGLFVGSFSVGVAIGRWGCLFTGLPDETYGIPTVLPWGVDLGDGIARHPVQLYESLAMTSFLAIYLMALSRRKSWAFHRSFYAMCFWYGLQRFAWEFLKPYPPILGRLNIFHLLCLAMMVYAIVYDRRTLAYDRIAP